MARSFSRLTWKCNTSKYHKKQSKRALRYLPNDEISNYSSFTKKTYQSWDICDYKTGSDKVGAVVRKGKVSIRYSLGD